MSETQDLNPFESPISRAATSAPLAGGLSATQLSERRRRRWVLIAVGVLATPLAAAMAFGCCCAVTGFSLAGLFPTLHYEIIIYAMLIAGGAAALVATAYVFYVARRNWRAIDAEYERKQDREQEATERTE